MTSRAEDEVGRDEEEAVVDTGRRRRSVVGDSSCLVSASILALASMSWDSSVFVSSSSAEPEEAGRTYFERGRAGGLTSGVEKSGWTGPVVDCCGVSW